VPCRLLTSSHLLTSSQLITSSCSLAPTSPPASSSSLGVHTSAAPRHGHGGLTPLYTTRYPPGPGTVTGHQVISRPTRADSDTGGPLGSGRLGSVPRSHHDPCSARPAEHLARADSDPSVQSRHMTLTTAAPPGRDTSPPARVRATAAPPGRDTFPPVRVRATAGQAPIVEMYHAADPAGQDGDRPCHYAKAYVGARLKLYVPRIGQAVMQGVSRIQLRPLFGTPCRPVGGTAGFEPHLHHIATCSYTRDCACSETTTSEPRPKAQVLCSIRIQWLTLADDCLLEPVIASVGRWPAQLRDTQWVTRERQAHAASPSAGLCSGGHNTCRRPRLVRRCQPSTPADCISEPATAVEAPAPSSNWSAGSCTAGPGARQPTML
jgi:hypothetical protein